MPSKKYKNSSPQHSPAAAARGLGGDPKPGAETPSSPQWQQPKRQGMTQPPPALLSHPWHGMSMAAQNPHVKTMQTALMMFAHAWQLLARQCPHSWGAALQHQGSYSFCWAAKPQHRTLPCRACRVLTMATTHPAPKVTNHPKRPLISELSTVGAQAAQCPELCCTCRLLPSMWSLNCQTIYKSLTNRFVVNFSTIKVLFFSCTFCTNEPWSAETMSSMLCICLHAEKSYQMSGNQ